MDFDHICLKPSARQNKIPVGTMHSCSCGTDWVVAPDDNGKVAWSRVTAEVSE